MNDGRNTHIFAVKLLHALETIYRRPDPPHLWSNGGNLPWNDPTFSVRMLREHLDESHGAASRTSAERALQLDWLWERLELRPDSRILDLTCGPGLYAVPLAQRGCQITGVDFSPASIAYAQQLAAEIGVADRCDFIEQDVTRYTPEPNAYDAALFLYGQLAVFPPDVAAGLLATIARSLKPGGRLCVELLNQERVDKTNSNWWFTDDKGLWGERPFLHLGERHWHEKEKTSVERYYILDLETADLTEIHLCDQTYAIIEMQEMLQKAGSTTIRSYPAWNGLELYDADEWIVYVAEK
jgi:SAM-dependent methyltransferase